MTILISKIMARCAQLLGDTTPSYGKWTEPQLFDWGNAGQREIARLKPDSSVETTTDRAVVAGTRQTSTAKQIIKVVKNKDGAPIELVDMAVMDALVPNWHEATAAAAVSSYMLDERDKNVWHCSPPGDGNGEVEIIEATVPTDMVYSASYDLAITIADEYEGSLLNYVMAMAHARDAAHAIDSAQRSLQYYNNFVVGLGRADLREKLQSPYINKFTSMQGQLPPAGV